MSASNTNLQTAAARPGEPASGSPDLLEQLSALADGELEARHCSTAVSRWAAQADGRRAWQAYQLIGDSLRSDELCGRGNEAAFLAGVRARLAQEPVVIAPAAVTGAAHAASRRRLTWLNGAAVAAGFAAVAGVIWVLNPAGTGSQGAAPQLAGNQQVPAPAGAGRGNPEVIVVGQNPVPAPQVPTPFGPMTRDPQLDAYLSAHRPAWGARQLATPTSSTEVPAQAPR